MNEMECRVSEVSRGYSGTRLRDGQAAGRYVRSKDLPALLSMWPSEVERLGAGASSLVVRRLMRALRSERQRGMAGHWTYDLTRHKRLVEACRVERGALRKAVREKQLAGLAGSSG